MSQRGVMTSPADKRPVLPDRSRLEIGAVISQQPGTNRVDVRLRGASSRVIRNVLVPYGSTFQTDDTVLICAVQSETNWVAITRIATTDEFGLAMGRVTDETDLHPPSNLAVYPLGGAVFGTWDAWPGAAVCFQVQYNTQPNDLGGGQTYTYGNTFIWGCVPPGRRYMRVRSLRYAPSEAESFWSAWTSWESATPLPRTLDVLRQLDEMGAMIQELWALHNEGEL